MTIYLLTKRQYIDFYFVLFSLQINIFKNNPPNTPVSTERKTRGRTEDEKNAANQTIQWHTIKGHLIPESYSIISINTMTSDE